MKPKYIDFRVNGKEYEKISGSPMQIHISLKGQLIGSHFITGTIMHYCIDQVGYGECGDMLNKLSQKKVIFFFDDLLEADGNDILNPGLMVQMGAEAVEFMSPKWSFIFTKCIECKGE